MPVAFEQISDTLTGITDQLNSGDPIESEVTELTETQMRRRNVTRTVIVLVLLSIITTMIILNYEKNEI